MGKIIMTGSMKGGVSKTVTTFNLAYSLQKLGKKVLAVDFDSQANLTTCFGIEDVSELPVTIGHLMMAELDEEDLPESEDYIQSRNGVCLFFNFHIGDRTVILLNFHNRQ